MKISILTKSISRNAGGLFEAIVSPLKLIQKNYRVQISVFGIRDVFTEADKMKWAPLAVEAFRHKGSYSIGYSPEIKRALFSESPDLAHTHGLFYYTSAVVEEWSRVNRKPYIVSPHGMLDDWALRNSRWKKKIAGFLFENKHLNNAYCIHTLSGSETNSVRSYGLKNPVCQIPNGIDLPDSEIKFSSPWDSVVDSDKKVLLYLGRIHPKKGLQNLLSAWANIRKDSKAPIDWALAIVGWNQGNHEEDLKTLVSESGIEDSVFFMGPKFDEEKRACYQNADGFILPSFSEGLPMVVLEAWANGLPVIMTRQCNIDEGFSADAAIEIDPDPSSIETGLRDFFSLPSNDRKIMGRNGYNLVQKRFTWEKVSENMYSVYSWIYDGGLPPSCVITD